ncbi:hypothetical protein [Peribacillus kribbensis]|uniref:hypothetical protein n=1 Tax=Peribacillus kribbensis TaxID=356658 RepID=UPI0003FBB0B5|nr:hypothetical protein [Peribacillus kribbensis]
MKRLPILLLIIFALAIPDMAGAKSFSGGKSSSRSYSGHSPSVTYPSRSRTPYNGNYNSGYKSPSNHITRGNTSRSQTQQSSRTGGLFSHAAAFGAGALFGHMLHPFGGSYYGMNGFGSYGFSFWGLIIDFVLIFVVIRLIRGIFSRNRRY